MTTIVGIQGDTYALVVADSRIVTYEDGHATHASTLGAGVGKIAPNGKYLLGAAGDMRAINILHHAYAPPTPSPSVRGRKLDAFMVKQFIPSLRECFDNHGYSLPQRESSEHLAEHASEIIAVIHGTIYVIDGDYSWCPSSNGRYALGSGAAYALGALAALGDKKYETPQQAKTAALKAINAATKYDINTGAPFATHIQELDRGTKR